MKVAAIGTGEAFDTGLGNHSYFLEGLKSQGLLIDCGYQIPERLFAIDAFSEKIHGIYLTHLHADHAFGMIPLLARLNEDKRSDELYIWLPKGESATLKSLCELGYPGLWRDLSFEVKLQELEPGDEVEWRGLNFQTAQSAHSVMNLALKCTEKSSGISVGFSGDGMMTDATRKLLFDLDFLAHEVYYLEKESSTHTNLLTLIKHLERANVRGVGIAHHQRNQKNSILQRLSDEGEEFLKTTGCEFIRSLVPGDEIQLSD